VGGHLMLLGHPSCWLGARRTPRPPIQQIIIQKTTLDQIVELVPQRQARVDGVAKPLMELTPGLWSWSQHLISHLLRRLKPGCDVGDGDQVRQPHNKLMLRRAVVLPGAPWAPALVFLWVIRMAGPLIPLGGGGLQHPLWPDTCLSSWPSRCDKCLISVIFYIKI